MARSHRQLSRTCLFFASLFLAAATLAPACSGEEFQPITSQLGITPEGIDYLASVDGRSTYIQAFTVSSLGDTWLIFFCDEEGLGVSIPYLGHAVHTPHPQVQWTVDGVPQERMRWFAFDRGISVEAFLLDEEHIDQFQSLLRQAKRVEFTFSATDGSPAETINVNVVGLFDTPVQPNLDRCGEY